MHVVGVVVCDWYAWLQESCLIQENERNSIVCDLSNIFYIFYIKINAILIVFLSFLLSNKTCIHQGTICF